MATNGPVDANSPFALSRLLSELARIVGARLASVVLSAGTARYSVAEPGRAYLVPSLSKVSSLSGLSV